MGDRIERFFGLRAQGTTVRTEIVGGITTFVTLSYIIFVQPAVLATTGMDPGAVMSATCLASALATLLMGVWANYPIAVAPAMGHNFYFAFVVAGPVAAGGLGFPWPVALGANCIAGLAFLVLSLVGLRERLIDIIPDSLKHAIAAGIGILIALVGFEWAGLVRPAPGTIIALGRLHHPETLLAAAGTLLMAVLVARGQRAAILIGTVATGIAAAALGLVPYHGLVALPPPLTPTFAQLEIKAALSPELVTVVFVLFFLGFFDTIGTLVGVADQANLLRDGRLPRARQAMATDAAGTIAGTILGTSTVTAYVESAAGVQAGARTGLANLVTAALLLAALFFSPLARMTGEGVHVGEMTLYPIVAPALIIVGSFMARGTARIAWNDPPLATASFLTLVMTPFTFSIAEGIAIGLIAYTLLMLTTGRRREIQPLLYVFVLLFLLRYAFLLA
jgi:AGZA family xanthine/uracil permease-like MFS transporter